MNDIDTINSHSQPICTCPHCSSVSITRSGFDRGIQRYRCKNCRKTFKATTGTPVHGLHKREKIERYLKALRKGMSVRKAAKYAGISKNTSFAWRHKFLSSLETRSIVNTQSKTSSVSLIQQEYSAKGRRKPPEKHTCPTKTIFILKDGQLELHKLASVRPTRHATKIFTKSPAIYFASAPHKTITAGIKHSENAVKLNNQHISKPINKKAKQHIAKLFCWMKRFKGVASKYLQNYWNWYASLLNLSQLKNETEHFCNLCTNSRSLFQYFATKRL